MEQPQRAHYLRIQIGSDTAEDLISYLADIFEQLKSNDLAEKGLRAASTCGYTYSYSKKENYSHEDYMRDLQQWLNIQKETPAEVAPSTEFEQTPPLKHSQE